MKRAYKVLHKKKKKNRPTPKCHCENSDPIKFRKNKTACVHRIRYWFDTTTLKAKTQSRNAFKVLEENNFHPMTIYHAKIPIKGKDENKEIFRYSSPPNNLSLVYPIHRKALQDMFHQHDGINQERG